MSGTAKPSPEVVHRLGPPPPLDAELAAVVADSGLPPSLRVENLSRLRHDYAQRAHGDPVDRDHEDPHRGGVFNVREYRVGGDGTEASVLICRPNRILTPVPVVYFIHGGGMVMGDNRAGLAEILDWGQVLGLAVASVQYRLAPETPHPGPVEDCYAGLTWLVEHAVDLGLDPTQVIVAGVSAGGGLAAAATLLLRDRGGPPLLGQMLICPMLDDRNDSASAVQMAHSGGWDRESNRVGWAALLGDTAGGVGVSPYAAPARAPWLGGLPPTFIDVGSAETFRDEDITYASRIWQAGGAAELHVWPGGFHAFDGFASHIRISRQARAARVAWLTRLLKRTSVSASAD